MSKKLMTGNYLLLKNIAVMRLVFCPNWEVSHANTTQTRPSAS